ncbi:MAG: hypothetical protein WBD02_09430 [Acidimicrobiia bacterium]
MAHLGLFGSHRYENGGEEVSALTLLANSELGEHTLWNPTLKGILVVISALVLFWGSVYMLLSTNVGARLGFLLALSSLTGFFTILAAMWLISASPLTSPHGADATWKGVEVVRNVSDSKIDSVRKISKYSIKEQDAGEIKAAADVALLTPTGEGGEAGPFAEFEAGQYQATAFYRTPGDNPNPLKLEFTHRPQYGVVTFCNNAVVPDTFPNPAPDAVCDPEAPNTRSLVLIRDLGNLKRPPFLYFLSGAILFALSLLMLHWREKDQRQAESKASDLVPASV